VPDVLTELRSACALVAECAQHVQIERHKVPAYAASLPVGPRAAGPDPAFHLTEGTRKDLAAFWLTLDAINFGSGWFPTLRKPSGRSGYYTVAGGLRNRFVVHGPWTAEQLAELQPSEIATTLGQDPHHKLMALFARSLNDLGRHVAIDHEGSFLRAADPDSDAVALVERLRTWDSFADASRYDRIEVPFLKRAQIAAADLARAGVAPFRDLARLTMFADNLVPHVLRLDGLLTYDPALIDRIERGDLLEHGSREEVEIRACALHAVQLIATECPGALEADVDSLLWHRGQEPRYKAQPRHRSRCTAY
jgi:Queuosine salvage protein